MAILKPRISAAGAAAAVGAGLAAALLSMLVAQKTSVALMMGFIAPLPIMIAALGFGSVAGLIAVVVGAIAVGVFDMRPEGLVIVLPAKLETAGLDVLVFAVSLGLPAWLLARLAAAPQPEASAPAVLDAMRPDERRLGRILACAIGFAAIRVGLEFAIELTKDGGFAKFIEASATKYEPFVKSLFTQNRPLPEGVSLHELAVAVSWVKMPMMAGGDVILLAFNLWMAARIAQTSGLFTAPWPDIPRFTRLPRFLALALAVALGLSFAGGILGMSSFIVSGALIVGFAAQGLAVVHDITRGKSFRMPLLILVYLTLGFLMPWLLVLYGIVGLADAAFAFRDREKKPPPAPGPWDRPKRRI